MKNPLGFLFLIFFSHSLFADKGFEGTFTVQFTNEKKEASKMEIKVKDSLVYLKHLQGGLERYDHYLLNLNTKDFYTVSKDDKKVIIKYNLDQLLGLYEKEKLKEGFSINSPILFKPADKLRREVDVVLAKYTGENEIYKSSFWLDSEAGFNFNRLIPLLRLLDCWNDAQAEDGLIVSSESLNKVSKRQSTMAVTMKKGPVSKDAFILPKNYLQKDFSKLLETEKNNKDLKVLVKTFAGF
jgi:hypothetical protein